MRITKKLINKLEPFWKEREKLFLEYTQKEREIEKRMNKKLGLKIELGFFYVDGECVGIGASNFSDRKRFRLIGSGEL